MAGGYRFAAVPGHLPDAVESNLISVHAEAARMARETWSMMNEVRSATGDFDRVDGMERRLAEIETYLDAMQEELTDFLTGCMRDSISEYQARNIQALAAGRLGA